MAGVRAGGRRGGRTAGLAGASGTVVECVGTEVLQRSLPDRVRAFSLGLADSVMVLAACSVRWWRRALTTLLGPVALFVGLCGAGGRRRLPCLARSACDRCSRPQATPGAVGLPLVEDHPTHVDAVHHQGEAHDRRRTWSAASGSRSEPADQQGHGHQAQSGEHRLVAAPLATPDLAPGPASRRRRPTSGGCRQRRIATVGDESVDKPDSVACRSRRRSSICDCCCQQPGAIYPEARASSPRAPPQTRERVLVILLPVGFTEPSQSPGMLVVSYTAVSPLPFLRRAVCFLWHCPAGHPGWALPTTVLCEVRTFLSPTAGGTAIAWPTRPPHILPNAAAE